MTASKVAAVANTSTEVAVEIWERRSIILTAFGLVGFGALVGAGSVYFFYIKRKIEEHFQIQSTVTSQLDQLKDEVEQLKISVVLTDENNRSTIKYKRNLSSHATKRNATEIRRVRFNDGYETADDELYLSASSGSENEDNVEIPTRSDRSQEYGIEDSADTEKNFLNKIDELLEGNITNQHEAFSILNTNQDKLSGSYEFWWRFAKATHYESNQAGSNGDVDSKKNLIYAACNYAEKALSLNGDSSDSHKWYAITLGSKGEFLGVKEKIKNGYIFKEHVDRAVKLNPQDSALHHLLGRFCFEVSQLSWLERKVAATLFSTPPSSTLEEALGHFLQAEKIGKPFKENRLFIVKCYMALKNSALTSQWLDAAVKMPVVSASDKAAQEQLLKLKK